VAREIAVEDHPGPWLTVVGSTMIDLVTYVSRVPERGETLVGERFVQGFGGKGANQAVMASLLGARVSMVNAVGDDGYGAETLANLENYGIDTGHVRRVPGSSGVAPIWVEADGSNRIIIVPGANGQLTPSDAVAAIRAQPRIDAVIGQFEIDPAVTLAAFRSARARGAITLLNPAPGRAIDSELAAATDWIIPNETEFAIIARANGLIADATDLNALTSLAKTLGTRLLVTLGDQGAALVRPGGGVELIDAPNVEAVDTTGAGDAFVGAFACALAAGWDETDAVRLGCAIACDSVTRPGTQSSFPDAARCRQIRDGFAGRP
jgi:ribokinase